MQTNANEDDDFEVIELEAKFSYEEEDELRIAQRMPLAKQVEFTDRYYDSKSAGYPLTTRNIWLRRRGDAWECKVSALAPSSSPASAPSLVVAQYREITSEDQILHFLFSNRIIEPIDNNNNNTNTEAERRSLEEVLASRGFHEFAAITTKRRTYKKPNNNSNNNAEEEEEEECLEFSIDFDEADFGYRVAEVEILVKIRSQQQSERTTTTAAASARIEQIAQEYGLHLGDKQQQQQQQRQLRGKIVEYLWRFDRHHYNALVEAGVIPPREA